MLNIFANGGGECYIVSVGLYDEISVDALNGGLSAVEKEDHPTILLFQMQCYWKKRTTYSFQQAMLAQCNNLQDRVAVLDVFEDLLIELTKM